MIHEPIRGPRRRWTWTLIGLLQIGNAAAFGAVATSVDFSAADESSVAANTEGETDAGANTAEESLDSTPATASSTAASSTTDASATDAPAFEPATTSGDPVAAADAADDATMPTFAAGPNSTLAELVRRAMSSQQDAATQDEPTPDATRTPVVVNAAANQLTVRFLVNGERIELPPGERRTLDGADTWVVRFDRGGQFGPATEVLYGGTHRFVVDAQGWKLEPLGETVTDPADAR
jgi:hypothetical protein